MAERELIPAAVPSSLLRKFLSAVRPRWADIVLLVGALFLLIATGRLFGGDSSADHLAEPSFWRAASRSLGEALLITWAVIRFVEPGVSRRFANRLGETALEVQQTTVDRLAEELLWALLGRDAPRQFRRAYILLAQFDQYRKKCVWTIALDWVEGRQDLLQVTLAVDSEGVNRLDGWNAFDHSLWAMSSVAESTKYLALRLTVPDRDPVELGEAELARITKQSEDGTINIEQEDLPPVHVPAGNYFTHRKVLMTRWSDDHVPLVRATPVLTEDIIFTGTAVDDDAIQFDVLYAGDSSRDRFIRRTRGGRAEYIASFEQVTFPGQVAVVSWRVRPRARPGSRRARAVRPGAART